MKVARPLEKDIQRAVCEYLELCGLFFWRSNNVPVYARSNDGVNRFRALPKFTPKGLPDIIIVIKGKFIGLEIKRPGEKLRPEQETFRDNLEKNDGIYYVVRSVEEVADIINFMGKNV